MCHMRIDKRLSQMLVDLFPETYQLDRDGCIYVKLGMALYVCVESTNLQYDEVYLTLSDLSFVCNPTMCVYTIWIEMATRLLCVYARMIF
jgi:hypothetical protein